MNNFKHFTLLGIFLFTITFTFSQGQTKSVKKKMFNDTRRFILASNYKAVLPIILNLQRNDTNNSNFNYLVGICYINSHFEKEKAIPYFKRASNNLTKKYKELKITEDKAPFKTMYYLGLAYSFTYQFDKAENYFNKYKELEFNNSKELSLANRQIEMCQNGVLLTKDSVEISIENLGNTINSEFNEHTPVLTTDEKTLIFTSRRIGSTGGMLTPSGRYFEDIYISHKINGKWESPEKISNNINTNEHEASICLSPDGKELYIYKDDEGNGNIYVSEFEKNEWTKPEKIGSNINTKANETHATISADGTTLIFVSDRGAGKGEKDLYIVQRLPGGEWGLAQNMGDVLNTKYDEEGPFLHPDGTTLYFSSKGHNSMGGYDLFYSELQPDDSWGTPVNMGYPINTTSDDVFFVLSADGKRAYFSSVREDGYGSRDLYVMNFLSLPERSSAVVKGTVKMENTGEIPKDIVIVVKEASTGKLIGRYKPNKETGNYIIILKQGSDFIFSCETPEYIFSPEKISIPDKTSFREINRPIILNPIGTIRKK